MCIPIYCRTCRTMQLRSGGSSTGTLISQRVKRSDNRIKWYPAAMADDGQELQALNTAVASIKAEIEKASPSRKQRIYEAVALAALSAIPWIGGVFAAGLNFK